MFGGLTGKRLVPVAAIIILTTVAMVLLPRALPVLRVAENWTGDLRIAVLSPPRPQSTDIIVVTITEDTLGLLPYRSPVDRLFLANLLSAVAAKGPRAVALDILFDQPTEQAKDAQLRAVLAAYPVPGVVAVADADTGLTEKQAAYLEAFTEGLDTGLANLTKDQSDGVVRWIFPGRAKGDGWQPGLVGALAGALGVDAPRRQVRLAYRAGPDAQTPPFRTFPAHMVPLLPQPWFAGKIVLVGADLPLIDRHRTPLAAAFGARGEIPGVLVHAHALAQVLEGGALPRPGVAGEAALVLAMVVLGVVLAMIDMPLSIKAAAFAFAVAAFWAAAAALFRYGGPLIPLVAPSLGLAAASGIGIAYLGRVDRQQKKFIRQAFARYISPSIVESLVADPSKLSVRGERRILTYLFTDLASFTNLTERTEPQVMVSLLNEYLEGMLSILFRHGATLDKIVGDAVVGFFNAPVDQPDHAVRAVRCALEMDVFGQEFVAKRAAEGMEVGITRIGINSGSAIIGNFGGDTFFDYTAHGDMVNTAARLESVNKHLGTRICVSRATAEQCPDIAFRPVGSLVLKGKTEGLEVTEPLSEEVATSPAAVAYAEAYELLQKESPEARAAMLRVLEMAPDDPLAKFHLRRLENGETGTVVVMKEK